MKLSAIYEAAYITLRGLGTLEGEEKNIREYFAAIHSMENAEELGAAAALWNCCFGAVAQHKLLVTLDEIKAWRTLLFTKVEEKLKLVHHRGSGFTGTGFIGGKSVAIYGYASVDGGRRSRRFEFSGSRRDLYRALRMAHRVVPSNRQRFVTVSARQFLRSPYRYGVEGVWVDKEIES